MWTFIASEATFFAFLIVAYVYFHVFGSHLGPSAKTSLDPVKTGIFSIFLISSSLTFWLAERALKNGSVSGLRMWLSVTIVFGAIFIVGQGLEYLHLFRENVTVSSNVFGSTFFTLTGLHGLHVLMGLMSIFVLLVCATRNVYAPPHSVAIESVGLYWHFVDAVWIVLFGLIYIMGVYA
jgi:heme/copper-type cytochrome/quinol oxidase subunit 3